MKTNLAIKVPVSIKCTMYHNRQVRHMVARESGNLLNDDCGDDNAMNQYNPTPTSLHKKCSYVMEHLATFTVNKEAGIVLPVDGMRRLLQMEKNIGIWSQKMRLSLQSGCVFITDFETGDLIERFPANLVECPTAFTSDDIMEIYNNVLVFIVSAGGRAQAEMHIFQSQSISAADLVRDIKALQHDDSHSISPTINSRNHLREPPIERKNEKDREQYKSGGSNECYGYISSHSRRVSNSNQKDFVCNDLRELAGVASSSELDVGVNFDPRFYEDTCSVSSEKYEREVHQLNSCFDDIEKFIARLQHAAAAVREIERRKHKKREIGDGLIHLHTKPPSEKEFIDILAKFKLSFNLLSKLKTHIHDPNAPELVHFLFTPLALIVEAARDTYETKIAANVIEPLLTRDTINFLINCVSSKETELWKSLGPSWTTPVEQYSDKHAFYNDVESHDNLINDFDTALAISGSEQHTLQEPSRKELDYTHTNKKTNVLSNFVPTDNHQDHLISMSGGATTTTRDMFRFKADEMDETKDKMGVVPNIEQWLKEQRNIGAHMVVVCYPRMANNDKELSVMKGEYLEILDDSRKWWKARNIHGQIGHVPSTIVALVHKN